MDFKNEIVLNGQYGPNGILLHQNAAKSFRSGLEINGRYTLYNGLEFKLVSSVSYNRIKQDGETLQPVLTSPFIMNADIMYRLRRTLYVGFNVKYNSKSYIDFANEYELPSYTIFNLYSGVSWKGFEIRAALNNIANELILGNAIMGYSGDPLYFAMAGINGTVSLTYKF